VVGAVTVTGINGTVRAVNGELDDSPSLTNEDPYHEGWLVEVELADEAELDELMAIEEYEELLADEDDS
jgi:glycine cleavage system H protein